MQTIFNIFNTNTQLSTKGIVDIVDINSCGIAIRTRKDSPESLFE